jgi:hypothetical protein
MMLKKWSYFKAALLDPHSVPLKVQMKLRGKNSYFLYEL